MPMTKHQLIQSFVEQVSALLYEEYNKGNPNAEKLDDLLGKVIDSLQEEAKGEAVDELSRLSFGELLQVCNNLLCQDKEVLEKMQFTLQKLQEEDKDVKNYAQRVHQQFDRWKILTELLKRLDEATVRVAVEACERSRREAYSRSAVPHSWGFRLVMEQKEEGGWELSCLLF